MPTSSRELERCGEAMNANALSLLCLSDGEGLRQREGRPVDTRYCEGCAQVHLQLARSEKEDSELV